MTFARRTTDDPITYVDRVTLIECRSRSPIYVCILFISFYRAGIATTSTEDRVWERWISYAGQDRGSDGVYVVLYTSHNVLPTGTAPVEWQ
jgi:hypothetical protein